MRLNSWILAWVQRAILDPSISLFDSNTFHPARNALSGSEHMIGVALQTLPLRWISDDAVALHQAAIVISALVLAWTSFALVRWATGSIWAAGIAAVAAMLAPWRLTELTHLQLLSVQWIPLVWLLVTRIGIGQASTRVVVLLAIVLGVQLLSSYYLAYFTSVSIAVLVGVLLLSRRVSLSSLAQLGAATITSYTLLAWFSIPYLAREASSELSARYALPDSSTITNSWAAVAPVLQPSLGGLPAEAAYGVSAVSFILALTALAAAVRGATASERSRGAEHKWPTQLQRVRILVMALWSIALVAFAMSLGRRMHIAGDWWPLPGAWLSAIVPGFSNLRVPHRWLILVGVAAPILAGLGAWTFERWLCGKEEQPRRVALAIGRAAVTLLLLATLPWRPLPVRTAMERWQQLERSYEALDILPPGPIVEIPWPMTVVDDIVLASRYTLSSTLHWRPTLNGFTAYRPPGYPLLQRIAQELPHPDAVRRLRSLAGLRFIVLHMNRLTARAAGPWLGGGAGQLLEVVYADRNTRIYEVTQSEETGEWTQALQSPAPRAVTLTGLSREALAFERDSGSLEIELPAEIRTSTKDRSWLPVPVSIHNRSDRSWPGLDVQREGLVELRYRFRQTPGQGAEVLEATAPLDADMPAGSRTVTLAYLKPPPTPGVYLVQLDLVQRLGDEFVPLTVRAKQVEVRVVP